MSLHRSGVGESEPRRQRPILRRALSALALAAAFGGQGIGQADPVTRSTGPPVGPPQPALTQEITADMIPIGAEIIEDYKKAKSAFRQKRILGGSTIFGTVNRTELTVEYDAYSTITHKKSETILSADFQRDGKHNNLNPDTVIGVGVTQPTRVIPPPIWRNDATTRFTYSFSAGKTDREALAENTDGLHWLVEASYYEGPASHLVDKFQNYVSGGGTTGPTFINNAPLSPALFLDLERQGVQVMHAGETHTPITTEPDLVLGFPANVGH